MTILVPQQNLLGAGGILQSRLSTLALPLQTLNPLSIFTGATTGASCCSSANYPQTYCDNNQGIIFH